MDASHVVCVRRVAAGAKTNVLGVQTAERQRAGLPEHRLLIEPEESLEEWVRHASLLIAAHSHVRLLVFSLCSVL